MRIVTNGRILAVGEVSTKNNFKKCRVRVQLPEVKDPDSGEVIRPIETFDCEYAIRSDDQVEALRKLAPVKSEITWPVLKLTLNLRSFWYKEKDIEKLGSQLHLRAWENLSTGSAPSSAESKSVSHQ